MSANVMQEHIEIVEGALGPKARIVGRRIRVLDVAVWHEKVGLSPDEIVEQHPDITLADVYAALAYYWDHRQEIEAAILAERSLVDEQRAQTSSPLMEKLRRRGG
jgi:uncharacterized protein (DUF433 family)